VYFVYMLGCLKTGRTYVGQTNDLLRRYRMHLEGHTRTTRIILVVPVVLYFEILATRGEAIRRERYFKSGSGHRVRDEIAQTWFRLFDGGG
jgi:putative endonuclease